MTLVATSALGRVGSALHGRLSIGFRFLAMVGVPVAVVVGSGGPETIPFWIGAVMWIPAAVFGAWPAGVALLLVLAPILILIDKFWPEWLGRFMEKLLPFGWVALSVAGYVTNADLGDTSGLRLPTPWPNVGVLLVIGGAVMVSRGLLKLADRFEMPKQQLARTSLATASWANDEYKTPPEPDEAYWSDQPVVGWRSWVWNGVSLEGVRQAWPTSVFTARCHSCTEIPGWDHQCGIYAVKELDDVFRFAHTAQVVGTVEMWGDVVEHEDGYRASHARITELWVDSQHVAEEVASRYDVEIHVGSPEIGTEDRHG